MGENVRCGDVDAAHLVRGLCCVFVYVVLVVVCQSRDSGVLKDEYFTRARRKSYRVIYIFRNPTWWNKSQQRVPIFLHYNIVFDESNL